MNMTEKVKHKRSFKSLEEMFKSIYGEDSVQELSIDLSKRTKKQEALDDAVFKHLQKIEAAYEATDGSTLQFN